MFTLVLTIKEQTIKTGLQDFVFSRLLEIQKLQLTVKKPGS